jgi:hypothetical protein
MRLALAALVGALGVADAGAQLVPLSQCGSALPCSIPTGLRPADAAALSPYGRVGNGNALVGVEVAGPEGFKPEVVTRGVAEDPSDRAARIFLKRNPGFAMPRTAQTPSGVAPAPSTATEPSKKPAVKSEAAKPAAAAKPDKLDAPSSVPTPAPAPPQP